MLSKFSIQGENDREVYSRLTFLKSPVNFLFKVLHQEAQVHCNMCSNLFIFFPFDKQRIMSASFTDPFILGLEFITIL